MQLITMATASPLNSIFCLNSSLLVSSKHVSNPTTTISFHPSLQFQSLICSPFSCHTAPTSTLLVKATGRSVGEVLPPPLTAESDPPPIFDGTARLYLSYSCPYAQRVWITRNCKGVQDQIKLVPLDLKNRPSWYKDKVYPSNKVPALEHNNEVIGESVDLIKYIDSHFDGPPLLPDDRAKKEFAEELFSYAGSFYKSVTSFIKGEANEPDSAFDDIEKALSKFEDGPFFLGMFSLVDIAYAPFIERFQPTLLALKNYDITAGRPKLAAWIQEMDKNEGYNETRRDPTEYVESYRKRFLTKA